MKLIENVKMMIHDADMGIVFREGHILLEGQYIKEINPDPEKINNCEKIEGRGRIAMPGLINTHTHAAMTLLRGYADDMELMPWLETKIWPQEAKLDSDSIYWASMLASIEMIKSGTTTFADMYFFMDDVARAVEEIGIRAFLSRGLIGLNDSGEKSLSEALTFANKWNNTSQGRITCGLAPHAPYTCPPDYLKIVIAEAKKTEKRIHIHLSETLSEVNNIVEQYGMRPVELMEEIGLFECDVLAAHCIHVNSKEIDILHKHDIAVAHNPSSNMKLASGIAPIPDMLGKKIFVGLGTDGTASNNNLNMFEEIHLAALLHKIGKMDPTVLPAAQVLDMATRQGAAALGLANEVGKLAVGMKADIILLDTQKPHLTPCYDESANLVYSAQGSDVSTVIIDGDLIMDNNNLVNIDEERVIFEVNRCVNKMMA